MEEGWEGVLHGIPAVEERLWATYVVLKGTEFGCVGRCGWLYLVPGARRFWFED